MPYISVGQRKHMYNDCKSQPTHAYFLVLLLFCVSSFIWICIDLCFLVVMGLHRFLCMSYLCQKIENGEQSNSHDQSIMIAAITASSESSSLCWLLCETYILIFIFIDWLVNQSINQSWFQNWHTCTSPWPSVVFLESDFDGCFAFLKHEGHNGMGSYGLFTLVIHSDCNNYLTLC